MCTTADEENDDHALLCYSGDCCVFLPLQLLFLMAEVTPRLCSASSPYISCSSQFDPWFQKEMHSLCIALQPDKPLLTRATGDQRPLPHNNTTLLCFSNKDNYYSFFSISLWVLLTG